MTRLHVNGREVDLEPGLDPARLSTVLRDRLGLRGTKVGCDAGDCGACTVLVDGRSHCACLTSLGKLEGRRVETVESDDPLLARLKQAFLDHGAAQCGICTPGMLMAALDLLRIDRAPDRAVVERALGGVLCRCTGYGRILAAVLSVGEGNRAAAAGPACSKEGLSIGHALPRLDGPAKVAGDLFGADVVPEGALKVIAIRSPHAHAAFELGDLDAFVRRTPGCVAVFTAADIPGRNAFSVIPPFADQPAIAASPARFRGECVALVALAPQAEAEAGGRIGVGVGSGMDPADFPIRWRALPALLSPAEAEAPGAEPVVAGRAGNLLVEGKVILGDAAAALAGSAHVVEGRFETAYVEHAYIEPEAGAAWMEGDVLCIRACTQAPVMDRDDTAAILGLPPERVRILPSAVGGGFGSKLDLSLQPLIGLVTLKTGRPARMVYGRAESMASTTKRHPAEIEGRIGCDAEGRITGVEMRGRFNTGAYSSWGPTVANRVPVHVSGPYRTPAIAARARAIHTHGPVSGAFRGFGVPQAALWQETLYDELADKVGMDRLEFRLLNALREGDVSTTGHVMEAVGIAPCLEALRPHWQRALAQAGGRRHRGVGLASCWYGCGNTALPNPSTIRIGVTAAGEIVLHQGATDIGQGSNTVIAQIAAEALGLPAQAFRLLGPDTFLTPDAGKTSASRQTFVSGRAAQAAGQSLRGQILQAAGGAGQGARLQLLPGGGLAVEEGARRVVLDLGALPANGHGYVLMAEESYDPPTTPLDANGQGKPYAVYGYGAQMVELEVDADLGMVRLIKITAAHDLGRVINPVLAQGQIEGGIAQGIGMALMEEYLPGRTENLHDYLIPTTSDVPVIESLLIEVPDADGPFGAKGLGEHVLIPTAPAILNAIRHACGVELRQVPVLPHRLRAALKEAGR